MIEHAADLVDSGMGDVGPLEQLDGGGLVELRPAAR